MKRGQIILCWITIGLAITAILMTLFVRVIPTVTITGETYIGLIVSFLGLLITFVVGFQIYNVMDFKERIKGVESQKDDLTTKNEEFKEEYREKLDELRNKSDTIQNDYNKNIAEIINMFGIIHDEAKNYLLAICIHVEGLQQSLKCNYAIMANTNLSHAMGVLLKITPTELESKYKEGDLNLKDAILKRISDIEYEFSDNETYKQISQRLDHFKQLLKKKIEAYETEAANVTKK